MTGRGTAFGSRTARPPSAATRTSAAQTSASAAVKPPAGTPDLGAMTVQPSDLAPGAHATVNRYTKPPGGFTAAYDRNFSLVRSAGGGPPFALVSSVASAQAELPPPSPS